jgi:hypothetical protein
LSRQIETTKTGYNFLPDRWIALNILHEFQEVVVVVVPKESLVVEEHASSHQTGITAETCHNF